MSVRPSFDVSARRARALRLAAVLLACGLALAGCKTTRPDVRGTDIATGSVTPVASQAPSVRDTLALQRAWQQRPGDAGIGLRLAAAYAALGQRQRQLQVLKEVVEANPGNAEIRYRYGIELLKANRAVQAEQQFRRLLAEGRRDWRTFNALGSALAEQNRHAEARRSFRTALRLDPDNPRVINNLAMSHMLDGDPARAEQLLRRYLPAARGAVKAKMRQNLALALGLQGRFEEARYMASHDLPPEQVEANMAWLRKMLGAGQTWERIAGRKAAATAR